MIRNRRTGSVPVALHFNGKDELHPPQAKEHAMAMVDNPPWEPAPLKAGFEIISVSTTVDPILFRQLQKQGVAVTAILPPHPGFKMADKLPLALEAVERSEADTILWCDSWDVVFQRHPNDAFESFLHSGRPTRSILIGGERNAFPDSAGLASFEAPLVPGQLMYPHGNAGFVIGERARLLAFLRLANGILESSKWTSGADQGPVRLAHVAYWPASQIDERALFVQNMAYVPDVDLEVFDA